MIYAFHFHFHNLYTYRLLLTFDGGLGYIIQGVPKTTWNVFAISQQTKKQECLQQHWTRRSASKLLHTMHTHGRMYGAARCSIPPRSPTGAGGGTVNAVKHIPTVVQIHSVTVFSVSSLLLDDNSSRYAVMPIIDTKARFPLPELTARVNGPTVCSTPWWSHAWTAWLQWIVAGVYF